MSAAAAGAMARPNLLSILRVRNFALLWGGQAISQVGDGLFYMAQIWLVLQLTGSALAMGTAVILTLLPRLVFQLIGGVSVDRYDRRVLMLLSDLIRGAVVLLFGILVAANQIQMIHVYILAIIFGIVAAFFYPAHSALIPNVVPKDGLVAANSLSGLTAQLSQIIGPAIGGALIALPFVGVAGVSFINAASFAVGALGIGLMRLPDHLNGARRTDGSFWHELGDGFRYLLGFRALVIVLLLAMVLNFAAAPVQVVLPIFAKNILGLGAEGLGVLMSCLGVGMVLGSIVIGVWSPRSNRGVIAFLLCALSGIFFIALGMIPIFPATLAILVTLGLLEAMVNAALNATMQGMIADEYRGRVSGVNMVVAMGLTPVALALGGALADVIGPGNIMAIGGVMIAMVSLAGLTFREIRALQ